jgi:hypothetical protein
MPGFGEGRKALRFPPYACWLGDQLIRD